MLFRNALRSSLPETTALPMSIATDTDTARQTVTDELLDSLWQDVAILRQEQEMADLIKEIQQVRSRCCLSAVDEANRLQCDRLLSWRLDQIIHDRIVNTTA